MTVNETKGYIKLRGKIWRLNNTKVYDNGTIRTLSFGLQANKDNSLFVQVGEWKNTKLNVKYRSKDMDEVQEVNEQQAIDDIMKNFKDGDSVFVNCRVSVNKYKKTFNLIVSQIYSENEEINFDSEEFKETNSLIQPVVIIEQPTEKEVKIGLTNYLGQMIEQQLVYSDDEIKQYFVDNVKVGDLLKLECQVIRKPKYVESTGDGKPRKTLKGKVIEQKNKTKDGYEEFIQIIDVDLDKVEKKKYTREDIRAALELEIEKKNKSNENDTSKIEEDELPY